MSLVIIVLLPPAATLDALHYEKAVVTFSPHVVAAFLWSGGGDHPIQREGDWKNFNILTDMARRQVSATGADSAFAGAFHQDRRLDF
jgi:hypothetical protein